MKTVFDGVVYSHYGQAYIHFSGAFDFGADVRKGQSNGLLGVAHPTLVFLTFGLHTGSVRLSIKLADSAPTDDYSWEEVVEASFTVPAGQNVLFSDWNGDIQLPMPLAPGSYRIRYSATNFREAEELSDEENEANPIEQYEVILWPAPARLDEVRKATRPAAQYWHDVARGKAR